MAEEEFYDIPTMLPTESAADPIAKRRMPHSIEAEQSVIGAMLMDKDALAYAVEHLLAEEFYRREYGLIFEALSELYMERKDPDFVVLKNKLTEKSAPPELCESNFFADIIENVPTSANIKHYCEIVSEKAVLRKLIHMSEDIIIRSYKGSESSESILLESEKRIYDLSQKQGNDDLIPIRQIVLNTISNIQAAAKAGGKVTGIPTGFIDLDYKTAGMQPSDLILIAARPSMGKTAFVLNIAAYACFKKNYHVAIFSLEMSKEQLVNRMIAMETLINSTSLRTGNLEDSDWDKLVEGADLIGNSNLMIDDTSSISVTAMRSKCRKMKMEHGLDMIIIDYLQLMSGNGGNNVSRQQEISDISRSLKGLARELSVPVLALSQLSRAVEQRPDHRPMLSDLRESGAIEQDADVVMFIYRDDYYNKDSEKKGIAEINIAKQRNGSIGPVDLVWLADYTKFGNLERKDQASYAN